MARLVEGLSRFFGRVEILALGLENVRRAAEAALARGRPLEAREHARAILAALPGSPLGLALWADAAEDAWLDDEAVAALTELAAQLPFRADVWLRLGRAAHRIGAPAAREALERAQAAPEERDSARLALLDLADLDLDAGDAERARRWLDRIPPALRGGVDTELALRRVECDLARGDFDAAALTAELLPEPSAADGRAALVKARLASHRGDPSEALDAALRAFVLETRGAAELLAGIVASSRDVVVVDRIRRVVAAAGALDEPAWAAAFAFAEGRRDDARRALARGLGAGDATAASALLRLATETRDLDALHALAARDPTLLPPELCAIRDAAKLSAEGRSQLALDRLEVVTGEAASWAAEVRASVVTAWIPKAEASGVPPARWSELLGELRRGARLLDRMDLVTAIEALAVERERPLRVAVVGEFNAGKSTFLNALLGEDVAPTGVLPTTATLHWVAWAPDPFARVVVRGAPDRVVPHAALKGTLRALAASSAVIERVFIYAPIERLKRVEILDTPGFNAPDPEHIASARQAFDEAHVAIWLLDATGPLRNTERAVLEQVGALGIPVQILINKVDRVPDSDRPTVLEHVREGLEASGLRSHAPPVAFSARLSLQGKLGDEAALVASGWKEVEALLAERIVDESDSLRERALRRRSAAVAAKLADAALARAELEREAARGRRERGEALRAAVAFLRRERDVLSVAVDKALEPARRQLAIDLRPIQELDAERQRDPGLRAYVEERMAARFAEPLASEIARAAGVEGPPRATAMLRAVLMGAAAAQGAPSGLTGRPLDAVVGAAIDAYGAALLLEADEPEPPAPSAAIEQRMEAVLAALGARRAPRATA